MEIDQEDPREEEEVEKTETQGDLPIIQNISPLPSNDEVEIIGENPPWEECKPFPIIEEPHNRKEGKRGHYEEF
jgi:hypothetical protein